MTFLTRVVFDGFCLFVLVPRIYIFPKPNLKVPYFSIKKIKNYLKKKIYKESYAACYSLVRHNYIKLPAGASDLGKMFKAAKFMSIIMISIMISILINNLMMLYKFGGASKWRASYLRLNKRQKQKTYKTNF